MLEPSRLSSDIESTILSILLLSVKSSQWSKFNFKFTSRDDNFIEAPPTWYSLLPWCVKNPTLSIVSWGIGVPLRILSSSMRGKLILKSQDPNCSTSRVFTFGLRSFKELFARFLDVDNDGCSHLSCDVVSCDIVSSFDTAATTKNLFCLRVCVHLKM